MFPQEAAGFASPNRHQKRIHHGCRSIEISRVVPKKSFFSKKISVARQQKDRFLSFFGDSADLYSSLLDKEEGSRSVACAEDGSSSGKATDRFLPSGLREQISKVRGGSERLLRANRMKSGHATYGRVTSTALQCRRGEWPTGTCRMRLKDVGPSSREIIRS